MGAIGTAQATEQKPFSATAVQSLTAIPSRAAASEILKSGASAQSALGELEAAATVARNIAIGGREDG
eukprot:4512374-Prymnesium_polylepis.1